MRDATKYEQENVIDMIDFHLALSDTSISHPDYLKALSISSEDFIRGQMKFIRNDLEEHPDGISKRYMEIMFMTVGQAALRYLIGDSEVERFIKAVEED